MDENAVEPFILVPSQAGAAAFGFRKGISIVKEGRGRSGFEAMLALHLF